MKKVFVGIIVLLLAACSGEKASFETQEQARQTVMENAEFNARVYRDANTPLLKIKMRGDSTISPACITGDGWATIDLVNDSGTTLSKLKCSTVSGTIGCMTETDFKERADYAKQDGTCNKEIPFPLPKIVK